MLAWVMAPLRAHRNQPVVTVSPPAPNPLPADKPPQRIEFADYYNRWNHLAPRDATVCAFIDWLLEIGEGGIWEQQELFDEYQTICELTGVCVMPRKFFGKALIAYGCKRWRSEIIVDGRRRIPYMVEVYARPRLVSVTDRRSKRRDGETTGFYGIPSGIPLQVINGGRQPLRARIERSALAA